MKHKTKKISSVFWLSLVAAIVIGLTPATATHANVFDWDFEFNDKGLQEGGNDSVGWFERLIGQGNEKTPDVNMPDVK